MTKNNYNLQMKFLFTITVIFSTFWLYHTIGRLINISVLTEASASSDPELAIIHRVLIITQGIASIALVALQLLFLTKQMKSLNNGTIFSKGAHKLIIAWAIVWILYNQNYTTDINGKLIEMRITGSTFGIPAILLTFAILYKIASDISEENNLTI